MEFYESAEAEAYALRRAAARVGCRIRTMIRTVDGLAGVRAELACDDGWQAAGLLLALAEEDSQTEGARRFARALRAVAPSDDEFARAIHARASRFKFIRERGEQFQSGSVTLKRDGGDCDDHFRFVYGVAVAGGLDAKLAILWHGENAPPDKEGPAHAVALLCPDGECAWAETTVAAHFGENPNDAARRLGKTDERSDIAKEVVIMSARDLPPVPAGFRSRSKPEQVARDSMALQRLGYLAADLPPCVLADPASDAVRAGVARAQTDWALVVDGLLGPVTRSTIARELAKSGDPFDYARMSGVTAAPPPRRIFTHEQAREALRAAFREQFVGREPTDGELDFGLATAYFETFYGRGTGAGWGDGGQFGRWAAEGKINWGALQSGIEGDERTLAAFRAAGLHPTKEKGADAGRPVWFYLFPSDVEAARAFLMSWGRKETLEAAKTGSATAVAAAMRKFGYYEGFHVGPGKLVGSKLAANERNGGACVKNGTCFVEESSDEEAERKNVADYASALARHVSTVRGAGGVPDPSPALISTGAAVGLLVLLGAVGAAAGAHVAGWWS